MRRTFPTEARRQQQSRLQPGVKLSRKPSSTTKHCPAHLPAMTTAASSHKIVSATYTPGPHPQQRCKQRIKAASLSTPAADSFLGTRGGFS